ncbi:MAG: hypothetical protein IKH51_05695 [Clostridia bacterium]|nr:hypothetical protein [Clostridia bacterium]
MIDVFRELLSNKRSELYLKNAMAMNVKGTYTVRELRRIMLTNGYVLLGMTDGGNYSYFVNSLDEEIKITEDSGLILIGES